jgi:copper resistance protein B
MNTTTTTLAFKVMLSAAIVTLCLGSVGARAQHDNHDPQIRSEPVPVPKTSPSEPDAGVAGTGVEAIPAPEFGDDVFAHILFNQFEGRTNGPDNEFRWDMEAWIGTDMNKLFFKSEGFLENGQVSDGITELLYSRPIPFL